MPKCPGQDQRFWKPDDIFDVKCEGCGQSVEFFKDELKLKCRKCGKLVINPKINSGCAEWCQYADQCLAVTSDEDTNISCNNLIYKKEK
jgi:ribosomal protein S27E